MLAPLSLSASAGSMIVSYFNSLLMCPVSDYKNVRNFYGLKKKERKKRMDHRFSIS